MQNWYEIRRNADGLFDLYLNGEYEAEFDTYASAKECGRNWWKLTR